MVSMPASSASRRSRAGGKGMPYAACSRSHHPAPTPTNARPPDSASRVAAALAVIPAGRKVTGVTSVPSRSRVSRPATRPSVTHGSGIGSQARSTCGIWMRWSITASPANPASSAASAIERSQPPGSSPHGKRETWIITASPCDERRSSVGAAAGAGVSAAAGESGTTTWTRSQPSSSSSLRTSPNRLSCAASAGAGTTYARSALRRRVSSGGVSMTTATAGSPAAFAASSQARRRPRSRPRVSTTVVSPRERRAATTRSRISNASSVASRSWAPEPTTPRRSSDDTISRTAVVRTGEMRLARPRGSDEDQECGIGQVLHTTECVRRRRSCRGRGWRGPSRAGPGRGG